MRMNMFFICAIVYLALHSCNTITIDAQLLEIERQIEKDVENAHSLLDNYNSSNSLNKLDRAYSNILLAAIDLKTNSLSSENDSLLNESIEYLKSNKYKALHAKALLYKGKICNAMDMEEDALLFYYEARDILKRYPDYQVLSKLYTDIGDIYLRKKIYAKALFAYNNAYECDSILGNKELMILSLCDLARLSLYENKVIEYEKYIEKAYKLAGQSESPEKSISYLDYFYSVYLSEIEDYSGALDYISKSISSDNNKKPYSKYLVKGEAFIKLHKYDSAQHYLSMSSMSEDLYTQATSYNILFELNQSLGNLDKAIDYLLKYQANLDSIITLNNESQTQTLIYKYDVEKAVLKVNSKNKMRLLTIITLFAILLFSSFLFFELRDKKRKIEKKEKEKEILNNEKEILKKEKEIRVLQNDMKILQQNIKEYEELKDQLEEYKSIIKQKEEELYILLDKDIENQRNKFKKTPIYKKIIILSEQEKSKNPQRLNYQEQEELVIQLTSSFPQFRTSLKETFPSLTNDDLTVCCLSILRLSTFSISLCFPVSGLSSIRKRKYDIKSRMSKNPENFYLYDFVFSKNKSLK